MLNSLCWRLISRGVGSPYPTPPTEFGNNIGFKESRGPGFEGSRNRGFKGKAIQNLLMFPVVVEGDRSNP
jgi:hypothetical protein